jgi:hypothetical protein
MNKLTREQAQRIYDEITRKKGPLWEDKNSPTGWGCRILDRFGGTYGYVWVGYKKFA